MKRSLLTLLLLGIAPLVGVQAVPLGAPQTGQANHEPSFRPAQALSVTDITVPYTSIASGTVVLDALVSAAGKVESIEVRRDLPSLTESAVSAVGKWKFSPATFAGKAIAARMPVAVTFRPGLPFAASIPLPVLQPQTDAAVQAPFQPAQVTRAPFPNYRADNIAGPVTVVLEMNLSATGEVQGVKVLRDVSPATPYAVAVAGKWSFLPATWNGRPVPSSVLLAFVFRVPILVTPGNP